MDEVKVSLRSRALLNHAFPDEYTSLPSIEIMTPVAAIENAITQGYRGWGWVSPNPLVGCVVLDKSGRFLASGFHAKLGGDHAEIQALKNLLRIPLDQKISVDELQKVGNQSAALKDSDWYVTLEPCAHEGRTPSCAKTLARLPIRRLTYAVEDPNPKVSGLGRKILGEAGIEALPLENRSDISRYEIDRLAHESETLAEHFIFSFRRGRPFVTLKAGVSRDGRMALAGGVQRWITSPAAREHANFLRAQHDAVLVGRKTLEVDNPRLDIRHEALENYPANRVVIVDPRAHALPNLRNWKVSQIRPHSKIYWVVDASATVDAHISVTVLKTPLRDGVLDLGHALDALKSQGIQSVFVEGGPSTIAQFIKQDLACRFETYVAPQTLGLQGTLGWKDQLLDPAQLKVESREPIAQDLWVSSKFV